ncbi:unnamed protein product [Diplocarpon coronariae]
MLGRARLARSTSDASSLGERGRDHGAVLRLSIDGDHCLARIPAGSHQSRDGHRQPPFFPRVLLRELGLSSPGVSKDEMMTPTGRFSGTMRERLRSTSGPGRAALMPLSLSPAHGSGGGRYSSDEDCPRAPLASPPPPTRRCKATRWADGINKVPVADDSTQEPRGGSSWSVVGPR